VRECPTIAVSIMQELAQRLHRSNGDWGEHWRWQNLKPIWNS